MDKTLIAAGKLGCCLLAWGLLAGLVLAKGSEAPAAAEISPPLSQYSIDIWDGSDGLPQIRIRAIVQTRDGYLWLGTARGLVRFDGVSFTTFGTHTSSLKDNEISSLVEDDDGALWVGTYGGGVAQFKDGKFTTYTTADGLPDNSVRKVDRDLAGNIWIATPAGVARYTRGKFTTFTTKDGLPNNFVVSICAGSPAGFFAVAGGRLNRFDGSKFVTQEAAMDASDGRLDGMACGTDGALWMTFEGSRIKCWKDGKLTTFGREEYKSDRPGAVYEDPQGNLWVSTRDGLVRYAHGVFEAPTSAEARMKLGRALSMLQDHEGNLWVGTEANGLARLRSVAVHLVTAAEGLSDSSTRCIYRDRKGGIWIGAYLGYSHWDQGILTPFKQLDGKPIPAVTSIGEDAQGRVWLAAGGQLLMNDNGVVSPVPAWPAVFDIKAIARDRQGDMWVGTDGEGLFRYAGGKFTNYRSQDGLPNNQIRAILSDRQGALWVGTTAGLCRFESGKFTSFGSNEGLAKSRIMALYEDADGVLWVGTRGGLSRFQNGRVFSFGEAEGLPENYVFNVLDDGQGTFWLSSSKGICHVRKADLDAVAAGKMARVEVVPLGYRDGLRSASMVAGTQPNACLGDGGQLLFCSLSGVVAVNPASEKSNREMPPVYLERVLINKVEQPLDRAAELRPGRAEMEVHYTALSYVAPEKVQFKYRLEGIDADWVDAGQRRFAYYANLPPGAYRFQVIACNNDGIWNHAGAVYSFRVPPRFYQTMWFPAAVLALVAGLVAGLYAWRIQRFRMHEGELQRRVDEAVAQVKVLRGLLPICMGCKKIRDDQGYWSQIDSYITRHANVKFSHGLCPDCVKQIYPDVADEVLREMQAEEKLRKTGKPGEKK